MNRILMWVDYRYLKKETYVGYPTFEVFKISAFKVQGGTITTQEVVSTTPNEETAQKTVKMLNELSSGYEIEHIP